MSVDRILFIIVSFCGYLRLCGFTVVRLCGSYYSFYFGYSGYYLCKDSDNYSFCQEIFGKSDNITQIPIISA